MYLSFLSGSLSNGAGSRNLLRRRLSTTRWLEYFIPDLKLKCRSHAALENLCEKVRELGRPINNDQNRMGMLDKFHEVCMSLRPA